MRKNHPRIKAVASLGKQGWQVFFQGKHPTAVEVETVRTTNLKTGGLLKKPVHTTEIVTRMIEGVGSRIVRRRKTLRKMGIRSWEH